MDLNENNLSLTGVPEDKASESSVNTSDKEDINSTIEPKQKIEKVIERLKEINSSSSKIDRSEVSSLKQSFYKFYKVMEEDALKSFVENGGKEEDFTMPNNEYEIQFKEIIKSVKEKISEGLQEIEKEQENNLIKKLNILDRMKALVDSPEDTNKAYNEFKKLQQEWKTVKSVPQAKSAELWKNYQLITEKFYDLIKLNNEFRDYDFKKNLEIKQDICERAEKLSLEKDPISAFYTLQKLHQEFRETGPVAKEIREEIWSRLKAASSIINKRHQEYFEKKKEEEQRNLDEKSVICEIVEGTEYDKLKSFQDWDNKTKEIIALQAKWKTIGYAPKKDNNKIFDRFRSLCDDFFKRKGEFFKSLKENMSENLEKKKALVEKVESLKDSTEWKETAEELIQIQKEWKKIGAVPRKHSDSLWNRFITACDYFFEQKNKANSSKSSTEYDNLDKKKALIEKLNDLNNQEVANDNEEEEIRNIISEWNNIGHVPFKEKDKLYEKFHSLIDELFGKLNISASEKKLNNFKNNIATGSNDNNLYREREKLVRTYESMKNDIQTYENNIGFLSSNSKKGNSLVNELNNKIEKLRADLKLVIDKIAIIDDSMKENKEK